jgi:hypothetical protein
MLLQCMLTLMMCILDIGRFCVRADVACWVVEPGTVRTGWGEGIVSELFVVEAEDRAVTNTKLFVVFLFAAVRVMILG